MYTRIPLPFANASQFEDPVNEGITHYSFAVKATSIERGFPLSVNPREQKLTGIYKTVTESLESNDGHFFQKNMGITILARSVEIDNKQKIAKINCGSSSSDIQDSSSIYGIINGGHTYKIILESNEKQDIETDKQFVRINIITGLKQKSHIQEIARAHNTSKSVQEMSLADFMDEFNWMKESLGNDLAKKISWHENDDGSISANDLICLLHCLNPIIYPDKTSGEGYTPQPTVAYSQKATCLKSYQKDVTKDRTFEKFKRILPDVLELKDFIQANAWSEFKPYTKGSLPAIFDKSKPKDKFLLLTDLETPQNVLLRAGLLPILASSRILVKNSGQSFSWKLESFNDVKEFCRELLVEQIKFIKEDIGNRNPTSWGKDYSLWSGLYMIAKFKYLELTSRN